MSPSPVPHCPKQHRAEVRLHAPALVLAAATFGLLLPAAGLADSATGPALTAYTGQQTAQAPTEPRTFDIPAGPLSASLNALGRNAGLTLAVDPALVDGKNAPALAGTYTVDQALQRLLAGSGLSYSMSGTTVAIERPGGNSGTATVLGPITVEGAAPPPRQAEIGNLPPAYAGGQVATGGKLGMLGNRSVMDTPFNQTSYTSKLIQDQQATSIGNAVKNDPSIHIANPPSSGLDFFTVRGFSLSNNGDILFSGLAGVAPTAFDAMMPEAVERIEVLKGPSALLNGAFPNGSIGGTVNITPKRAGEEPLLQLTPSYISNTQFGGHVDVGRRFGEKNEFGIRFNGVYRRGDTPIDHNSREARLAALGLDYRGNRLRVSSDLAYQEQDFEGTRRKYQIAAGVPIPDEPDNTTNAFAPFSFNNPQVFYGTLRGEFDFIDAVTGFMAVGASQKRQQAVFAGSRTITDAQGTLSAQNGTQLAINQIAVSGEVGLRAILETGPVGHQAVISHGRFHRETRLGSNPYAIPSSNIYNPVFGPEPPSSQNPDLDDVPKVNENKLSSTALADTLSLFDDRIQATLGVRYQEISSTGFDGATGAITSSYDENAITPMVGLLVKPWENVSLYANYIEGLQAGATAPAGTANAGEIFAPFISKQYEIGAKWDLGQVTTTLAAFQITQPSSFTDPITNVFGVNGEQRNRGIEFNVFGEVIDSVRLLGGATYIDATLTKTAGGVNDGNSAQIPKFRTVLAAEWDTFFLKGLTVTGRAQYASSQYLDAANTQKLSGWTQIDLGARYAINRPKAQPIIIRFNVENVLDSNAWRGENQGQIFSSEPRTFSLSATFSF